MATKSRKSAASDPQSNDGAPSSSRKRGKAKGAQRGLVGRLFSWAATAAVWGGVAVVALVGFYALDLPDLEQMTQTTRRPAISFVAADGEVFASYGDIYGEAIDLSKLPPDLPHAVMATEDRRFYDHFGIDLFGLGRAVVRNVMAGHVVQGGSTLTQQLAKNLFLSPERSLKRKVQELLMALQLERKFTKDQILTLYLNRVYLGSGTFGVDAAAKRYFGISARDVSLYQSAMLAGLLKAPSRYNPLADREASHNRTRTVLAAMVDAGYITEAQAKSAEKAGPGSIRNVPTGGRYFADWLAEQVKAYAGNLDRDLVVRTTLDMKLQRKVEAELETVLAAQGAKQQVSQGAVVVMSPDGAIRAMAGGRDYNDSQFNRATQGLRQPGSAFKPFVYLAALEDGMDPDDQIEDAPIKLGKWKPGNYNGKFEGMVSLRHALANSTNTVAVRLIDQVGPERVAATARKLGITAPMRPDASLALGTSEVNLLELTSAYAPFANGGFGAWAYGLAEVRDATTNEVVYMRTGGGPGRQVAPHNVRAMNEMLAAVILEGTGKGARLDRPAAGKTGTTQDYKDAWFVGYTADYVAGVWLGNDDGALMKRVTGGSLPAQLWAKVMRAAHTGLPPRDLPETGWEVPSAGGEGEVISPVEAIENVWDSLVKGLLGG